MGELAEGQRCQGMEGLPHWYHVVANNCSLPLRKREIVAEHMHLLVSKVKYGHDHLISSARYDSYGSWTCMKSVVALAIMSRGQSR